jgi:hypothetical protein
MRTIQDATELWVCTDCYWVLHFGDPSPDEPEYQPDREPLGLVGTGDLTDWTDSETDEGIQEFSWSSCDGCGLTLGGSRYRLAYWSADHHENEEE